MDSNAPSGTEGYSEQAPALLIRYEDRTFEQEHGDVVDFFPSEPSSIVDIGAGTGRDAGHFAALGHRVLAVEPTRALREPAMELHPEPSIEWMDDWLPELAKVLARRRTFDVVNFNAVWMHLDLAQRQRAMESVAQLCHTGTRVFFLLRHGPVPRGRRMFDVSGDETIALAEPFGLAPLFNLKADSNDADNLANGIRWTRVVLEKQ
jgi:SAM-dependent methyltransferase